MGTPRARPARHLLGWRLRRSCARMRSAEGPPRGTTKRSAHTNCILLHYDPPVDCPRTVPLPPPTLTAAHGVLNLRDFVPQSAGRDERFIAAVRSEFPNTLNRVSLPQEAPPNTPHLVLASTSSQLAVSRVQADFEVRFYGDYLNDNERALQYVERKLATVMAGFEAVGSTVSMIGVIGTLRFSFAGREDRPVDHILQTHLRTASTPPRCRMQSPGWRSACVTPTTSTSR